MWDVKCRRRAEMFIFFSFFSSEFQIVFAIIWIQYEEAFNEYKQA